MILPDEVLKQVELKDDHTNDYLFISSIHVLNYIIILFLI